MALTGLDSEMMKRLRPMPITPIQAPRGVMPKDDPTALQRFGKVAMDEGASTLSKGAVDLGKKYGAPLMKKGWASLTGTGAAPTMSSVATPLMEAGVDPLISNAIAKQSVAAGTGAGVGTGMMGSLGSMGTAAMASPAAPIIGGLLAMKMLGFFNEGGHVGPLYADEGTMVFPDPELPKGRKHFYDPNKEKYKPKGEKYIPEAGSLKGFDQGYDKDKIQNLYGGGIAGPLSKLQVKSANGETVTMSYGGTVKQGG